MRETEIDEFARERFEGRTELGWAREIRHEPVAPAGKPPLAGLVVHPPRQRPLEPPRGEVFHVASGVARHAGEGRPLEIRPQRRMVFEKRAARRREPRNLEPVPQGVAIQEHPQHHHLVRLVEARRLEHPEPRPEPLDDALLARIEIPLGSAKPEPTAVGRSQRVRQIVSMQKLRRRRPPPELRPHAAIRLLHRGPARRQKPREQLLRLELHVEHAALRKRRLPAVEISLQK